MCTNKRATNPQSDTWNLICKAKVLSKVKVFGWKLSTDSLGINFRRNIDHVPTCHICGVEAESGSVWKQHLYKLQHSRRTQMHCSVLVQEEGAKKQEVVANQMPPSLRKKRPDPEAPSFVTNRVVLCCLPGDITIVLPLKWRRRWPACLVPVLSFRLLLEIYISRITTHQLNRKGTSKW